MDLFIVTLLITFIITRIGAHILHDHEGYKIKKEKSKTFTGFVRRKSGYNFHHIHLGALILFILVPIILIYGINKITLILFAIGTSLFIDEIVPYLFRKIKYFSLKDFFISLFLHLFIIILYIININ